MVARAGADVEDPLVARAARAARTSARRRAAARSSGRRRSAAARCPTPPRRAPPGRSSSRGTARIASSTRSSVMCAAELIDQPVRGRSSRHHAARGAHFGECALGVARLDLDAADRAAVDRDGEACPQRVERGVLDAVVGGEADDGDLGRSRARAAAPRGRCPRSRCSRRCRRPGPCRRSRRAGCDRAPDAARRPRVPATQCTGHGPPLTANDEWSAGCQSRVATTRSKSPEAASALSRSAITSPSATASAPPGVKSFWKSTIMRARDTGP